MTVAGQAFQHILYHYRLAYSGWQYVQVIQGGESFVGLSQGLQNSLHACGGVPHLHRTDRLSAAYRNTGGRNPQPTGMYAAICDHYRMRPTRNNTGVAHENGSIESSHGCFQTAMDSLTSSCLKDAMLSRQFAGIRGSDRCRYSWG